MATSEELKVMFDLEQRIGRKIIGQCGIGWEGMIRQERAIPNRTKCFCTTMFKMQPGFEFLYIHHGLPVRIGYCYEEHFKFAYRVEWHRNMFAAGLTAEGCPLMCRDSID